MSLHAEEAPVTRLDAERMVRSLADPAAVIRSDFTIIAANQAYASRFTENGGEVVGRRCYRTSHGYPRPCAEMGEQCPLAGLAGDSESVEAVHEHYTKKGKETERVVISPLRSVDGASGLFVEVLYPVVKGRRDHEPLIGASAVFRRMMAMVDRVAHTDIPVLLLGESGTGKELVAREVHARSTRRHHPFVPVDCSGLAETLFESELFGHERGAFTGASQAKRGLVEAANGGTLFLDEIGDVPLSQQVKLLRLLETHIFRRVGSVEQRQADFRLVCATHRNLRDMVDHGHFRRDLYYRINVFPIETPPLRERIEDISALAREFLSRFKPANPCTLSPEARERLERYSFPGNVRELLNILQRACLMSDGGVIREENLPFEIAAGEGHPSSAGLPLQSEGTILSLDELERRYLQWVSRTHAGSRSDLAQRLGITERTLYRKLAELSEV